MNEVSQKGSLSAEEKQRLTRFFELLIQIDRREKITKSAQKHAKGARS